MDICRERIFFEPNVFHASHDLAEAKMRTVEPLFKWRSFCLIFVCKNATGHADIIYRPYPTCIVPLILERVQRDLFWLFYIEGVGAVSLVIKLRKHGFIQGKGVDGNE